MVEWSIDAFRACRLGRLDRRRRAPGARPRHRPAADDVEVVAGGATRAESVANALAAVETELVAIHDAARPLLTPDLVEELVARLEAAPEAAGVIAAAPVTDTVKRAAGTRSAFPVEGKGNAPLGVEPDPRSLAALGGADAAGLPDRGAAGGARGRPAELRDAATDEAMLVEAAGGTVLMHPAGAENLKVTTPLDLRVAELLLAERASGPSA